MSGDVLTSWGVVVRWERPGGGDAPILITIEDVFALAQAAYLHRCAALAAFLDDEGAVVRVAGDQRGPMAPAGVLDADAAVVGVSVVEVRPSSFDMAIRIRPDGEGEDGDDPEPANLRRTLVLERSATGERLPIPREVRDEFIALQLAARGLC